MPAARLASSITPRIVNAAWPIDELVADRDAERGQQLRPDQRAVILEQRVRVRLRRPRASSVP